MLAKKGREKVRKDTIYARKTLRRTNEKIRINFQAVEERAKSENIYFFTIKL